MNTTPAESVSDDRPNTSAFQEEWDWTALRRGQTVELRRSNTLIRRGVVEDITGDATMLWLSHYGAEKREILHREDGYQLWVDHSGGEAL